MKILSEFFSSFNFKIYSISISKRNKVIHLIILYPNNIKNYISIIGLQVTSYIQHDVCSSNLGKINKEMNFLSRFNLFSPFKLFSFFKLLCF